MGQGEREEGAVVSPNEDAVLRSHLEDHGASWKLDRLAQESQ